MAQVLAPVNTVAKEGFVKKAAQVKNTINAQVVSTAKNQYDESDVGQGLREMGKYTHHASVLAATAGASVYLNSTKYAAEQVILETRNDVAVELLNHANEIPSAKFLKAKRWEGPIVKNINDITNWNNVIEAKLKIKTRNQKGEWEIKEHILKSANPKDISKLFSSNSPDATFGEVVGYEILKEEKHWHGNSLRQHKSEYEALCKYTAVKFGEDKFTSRFQQMAMGHKLRSFEKQERRYAQASHPFLNNDTSAKTTNGHDALNSRKGGKKVKPPETPTWKGKPVSHKEMTKQYERIRMGRTMQKMSKRDFISFSEAYAKSLSVDGKTFAWNGSAFTKEEAQVIIARNNYKILVQSEESFAKSKGRMKRSVVKMAINSVSKTETGDGFRQMKKLSVPATSAYKSLLRKQVHRLAFYMGGTVSYLAKASIGRGVDAAATKITTKAASVLQAKGHTKMAGATQKLQAFGSQHLSVGIKANPITDIKTGQFKNQISQKSNLTKSIRTGKVEARGLAQKARYYAGKGVRTAAKAPFKLALHAFPPGVQAKMVKAGKKVGKFAKDTITAPFRFFGAAFQKLSKVISILGSVFFGIIIVDIIFLALCPSLTVMSPTDEDDMSNGINFDWIVAELDKNHDALVKRANSIIKAGQYDEYRVYINPSDGVDNYKEIVCAVAVMVENDFSDTEKVKSLIGQLYEASHSITQVISSYTTGDEENREIVTVCSITVNIADKETLLSKALVDEVDDSIIVGDGEYSLGWVGRRYEGSITTVSTSSGDYGGYSYGAMQFCTYSHTVISRSTPCPLNSFLDYMQVNFPDAYAPFKNLLPNSSAFISTWQAQGTNPDFAQAQYSYTAKNYYQKFVNNAKSYLGIDFTSTYALQEFAYATAVHFGSSVPSNSWFQRVASGLSSKTDEKEIIKTYCQYIYDNRHSLWSRCSVQIQESCGNRYNPSGPSTNEYHVLKSLFGKTRPSDVNSEESGSDTSTSNTNSIVATAQSCIGNVKYSKTETQNIVDGTGTSNVCGFTRYVFNKHGVDIGSDIDSQLNAPHTKEIKKFSSLQAGDLVFFKISNDENIGDAYLSTEEDVEIVGIYAGNNTIIYMSPANKTVVRKRVTTNTTPSTIQFFKGYRIADVEDEETYLSSNTFPGWTEANKEWYEVFYTDTAELWENSDDGTYVNWRGRNLTTAEIWSGVPGYDSTGQSTAIKNDYTWLHTGGEAMVKTNEFTGADIVNEALKYIGTPYVCGGESLTKGTDCSGFVMLLYKKIANIDLAHSTVTQATYGKGVTLKDAQPGDIVCYDGHVLIFGGKNADGTYWGVGAQSSNGGVKRVNNIQYQSIITIRRIIESED